MISKLQWARAFIDQAQLDSDLATSLYSIVINNKTELGPKPELYFPAVYAYCQQAVEKALKALLWYEVGTIPRKHNPLGEVMNLRQMDERNRPVHLRIIYRSNESINYILNMAPGAASENIRMRLLLKQTNTEYPFVSLEGIVKLPFQEISRGDVAASLKIARPLVLHIRKYLEAAGLAQSHI